SCTMSSYQYLPLPSEGDYIRLLRLLPNKSEAEPLRCKLDEYSLQKLGLRTHRYEALSYVWGDLDKTLSISVDEDPLLITVNLHDALSRLRDHSFERIIWVDAICINQKNPEERTQQVQLMAKIYSNAFCVIVWLGEKPEDTHKALEDIRLAANEKLTERSNQQAIRSLLQRRWFQRIWVLQEVAAARHVVIMCGSTEIDGYAFCLGLKSLRKSQKLSFIASPELQSLPSLTDLIERAGLRPKHITNSLERYSLEICSLAELVDMFHTREASDKRDKVYALLGMSSDDPGKAGLRPDYGASWKTLFEQLVKFILGEDVSVETSDDCQRAVIKIKGCILGQVSSIRMDDRQNVNVTRNAAWDLGGTVEWTLQASAKPIQVHDIICLLHGASKPTIIRLCKDHFAVIVIAATPLNRSSSFGWPETSQSITQFLRDFLLVWDWKPLQGKLHDQGEYETLTKTYSQALDYSKAESGDYLDEATKLWNDIMILDDLGEYDKADER
ncbi:HET-domain-containing protein, partial [Cadophora sp. DSE1049]